MVSEMVSLRCVLFKEIRREKMATRASPKKAIVLLSQAGLRIQWHVDHKRLSLTIGIQRNSSSLGPKLQLPVNPAVADARL